MCNLPASMSRTFHSGTSDNRDAYCNVPKTQRVSCREVAYRGEERKNVERNRRDLRTQNKRKQFKKYVNKKLLKV